MAKISMTCPFSNKACVECAIYRGRHFYLCSAKAFCKRECDVSRNTTTELLKAHGNKDERFKMRTNMPARPTLISNVEDFIEAEELSRFKEKRRKA